MSKISENSGFVVLELVDGFGENTLKFIYSEKATEFCEIFTLLLTTVHTVKSKVKILQNFVAFSEYMNFKGSTSKNFWQTILTRFKENIYEKDSFYLSFIHIFLIYNKIYK